MRIRHITDTSEDILPPPFQSKQKRIEDTNEFGSSNEALKPMAFESHVRRKVLVQTASLPEVLPSYQTRQPSPPLERYRPRLSTIAQSDMLDYDYVKPDRLAIIALRSGKFSKSLKSDGKLFYNPMYMSAGGDENQIKPSDDHHKDIIV